MILPFPIPVFSIAHSEQGPFFFLEQMKVVQTFLKLQGPLVAILAGFLDMTLIYVSATPIGQSILHGWNF